MGCHGGIMSNHPITLQKCSKPQMLLVLLAEWLQVNKKFNVWFLEDSILQYVALNWDASSPAPCGISVVFSHRRHLPMEQLKSHETPLTNQIDKENKRIRTATKNKQVILWNEATNQFEYTTTGSGLLFWHSLPCSEALILIHSIRRQCHHPVIIMTNDPTRFQIHGIFRSMSSTCFAM